MQLRNDVECFKLEAQGHSCFCEVVQVDQNKSPTLRLRSCSERLCTVRDKLQNDGCFYTSILGTKQAVPTCQCDITLSRTSFPSLDVMIRKCTNMTEAVPGVWEHFYILRLSRFLNNYPQNRLNALSFLTLGSISTSLPGHPASLTEANKYILPWLQEHSSTSHALSGP